MDNNRAIYIIFVMLSVALMLAGSLLCIFGATVDSNAANAICTVCGALLQVFSVLCAVLGLTIREGE